MLSLGLHSCQLGDAISAPARVSLFQVSQNMRKSHVWTALLQICFTSSHPLRVSQFYKKRIQLSDAQVGNHSIFPEWTPLLMRENLSFLMFHVFHLHCHKQLFLYILQMRNSAVKSVLRGQRAWTCVNTALCVIGSLQKYHENAIFWSLQLVWVPKC